MPELRDPKSLLTMSDIEAAAERLKNWGRWGPAHEIGTLNCAEPHDIGNAARLVTKGKVMSLAFPTTATARKAPRPTTRRWAGLALST